MSARERPRRSIPRGIYLLARGRAEGLDEFAATREGFLASLAPWIAFPLVASGILAMHGHGHAAISAFLATLCALLAPPVISEAAARLFRREALWLRFATAFNWSQWALPPVGLAALFVANAAVGFGLPPREASILWYALLGLYALWLHWFLLYRGLALPVWRAAGLVVVINVASAVLVLGPQFLARFLGAG